MAGELGVKGFELRVRSTILPLREPWEIIEKGGEYRWLYKLFCSKLRMVKRGPVGRRAKEPFINFTPSFEAGWGFKARLTGRFPPSGIRIQYHSCRV